MALRNNMLLVALGLALLGNVMVYSATAQEYGLYYLAQRFLHLGLGIGVFFAARGVRYTEWRRWAPVLYVGVLVLLFVVLVPGVGTEVNGARRWIHLGVFNLQPAELAKVAAVVVLASAVARLPRGSGMPVRPLLAVGLLFGLVVLEPDFGTSVVIAAGAAGVLWASEIRTRNLALWGLGAVGALVGVMLAEEYRRERLFSFFRPQAEPDGASYQVGQSIDAIRAGDYFGAGAGAGSTGPYIPEVWTDMIFALVGEELGLLGMVAVIGAFAFLCLAALAISLRAPTTLGRCLAAGFASMFAAQTVFNIGATMGIVPLAGMTLPFVSWGGSSLITCFAVVGILYRISEDGEIARAARPRRKRSVEHARSFERRAGLDRGRRDGGARYPRAVRGG
jgi:cell division protein FtsW